MEVEEDKLRELRDKLSILYALSISKFPLTRSELEELVLRLELMDYIKLGETVESLIEAGFIGEISSDEYRLVRLTELGVESLTALLPRINAYTKSRIDGELASLIAKKDETSFTGASYRKIREDITMVKLDINDEDGTLLELNLRAGSNEKAISMINIWKKDAVDILHAVYKIFELE